MFKLGGIGARRLAAGLVELAVNGPARLVLLTSTQCPCGEYRFTTGGAAEWLALLRGVASVA
jgi:hypothetical protein